MTYNGSRARAVLAAVLTLVGPAPSGVAASGPDGSMIELPFACLNPRCV